VFHRLRSTFMDPANYGSEEKYATVHPQIASSRSVNFQTLDDRLPEFGLAQPRP